VKSRVLKTLEHWDVIQPEATKEQSKSELPMGRVTIGKKMAAITSP
jgi:hypothetical protein